MTAGQAKRPIFSPGDVIRSGLVVDHCIGHGGMGEVYLAVDSQLGRKVAVKALYINDNSSKTAPADLLLEARAMAQVVHPNVVSIYAMGEIAGTVYLEMEYIDGPSLRDLLDGGKLAIDQSALWIAQLGAALDFAHDLGVLHCDIKPDNVLLRRSAAGKLTATLVDFGLARSRADGTLNSPITHGTMAYLAPELAKQPPQRQSDVFALAAIAHELLFGVPPVRNHWQAAAKVGTRERPASSLLDAAVVALSWALDADPQARPPTAGEFVDALLRGLQLGHLRAGVAAADPTTTAQLAIPLYATAQNPEQLQHLVTALLALIPFGFPRALPVALGCAVPPQLASELRHAGVACGLDTDLSLAAEVEREPLLRQLDRRTLRTVMARAAVALEITGQRTEATRQSATRLYVSAHRIEDAARLALESAANCRDARTRRQHMVRGATYCASATKLTNWLEAVTLIVEWDVACGWVEGTRAPLADAQGLLAELGLSPSHLDRLRVELSAVWVSLQTGALATACTALDRIEARAPLPSALVGVAAALRLRGHLMAGDLPKALDLLRSAPLERLGSGWTEFWAVGALLAQSRGEQATADRFCVLARTAAIDTCDDIGMGRATLTQAELHYHRGEIRAALRLAEAAVDVLRPRGLISLQAYAYALRGHCHVVLQQPMVAAHWLTRADGVFAELGLMAGRLATLTALGKLADSVTDPAASSAIDAELHHLKQRIARSGQVPPQLDRIVFAFLA